ncbi:MAG: Bax inhibitor-1/YccA family protein [Anaerolineae bacterium]|nr:Bax inhibitor-1/YccA family protein [Anaerolineae bacterium]
MLRWVYLWMALGLFVTAGVAYMTVNTPALLSLLTGPAVLIAFVVELILVFSLAAALPRLSPGVAAVMFFAYSALNGFVLASIFLIYEIGTITAAFGATAALFGAMTIVGFTTKLDLTRMRTFLMMGLIGLVIAMVVNMFIASSGLDLIISIVGVLIFTALTAYDTQKLQRIAANPTIQSDGSLAMKLSILGALTLYLDFINLFLFLLRILGGGRRS